MLSRQAFRWPRDEQARLIGGNPYEDKTSPRIAEAGPAEAATPARVRGIHLGRLARPEQAGGDNSWVPGAA